MTSIKQQKQDLRKLVRVEINDLTEAVKIKESEIICQKLAKYITQHIEKGSIIGTFAGLDIEPDLLALHQLLPDYRLAYPKCESRTHLHFYLIETPDIHLTSGSYGIKEPKSELVELISPDTIALFIIPAYAYSPDGLRLGKGAGYYDRVLSALSEHVSLVGTSFSIQIKEQIPIEEHDIKMHCIITGTV